MTKRGKSRKQDAYAMMSVGLYFGESSAKTVQANGTFLGSRSAEAVRIFAIFIECFLLLE
jgi:hypothetical protein